MDLDPLFTQDHEQVSEQIRSYESDVLHRSISQSLCQSIEASSLIRQHSQSSSNSESLNHQFISNQHDNVIIDRKRSTYCDSTTDEDRESSPEDAEDSNERYVKQDQLSLKPAKKKVKTNIIDETEKEQDFSDICRNLKSLPPTTGMPVKMKIDEVIKK